MVVQMLRRIEERQSVSRLIIFLFGLTRPRAPSDPGDVDPTSDALCLSAPSPDSWSAAQPFRWQRHRSRVSTAALIIQQTQICLNWRRAARTSVDKALQINLLRHSPGLLGWAPMSLHDTAVSPCLYPSRLHSFNQILSLSIIHFSWKYSYYNIWSIYKLQYDALIHSGFLQVSMS